MRIAHIIWALETGGAETMLVDIVNEQVKTEQVAILVVNDMVNQSLASKVNDNCKVRFFGRKLGSKSLMPWIQLNAFLWKYSPDVIHFHLEGMRKMVFHPAPKVFTIHNIHTSGREYRRYDALYAISDGVKEYTRKQGFEATTIWNGIDTKLVIKRTSVSYKPGDKCRMVCVGRLFLPHKGQDVLINALAIIKQRGITEFHLDLIGDGESREELEDLIKIKGIHNFVSLLGQQDRSYVYQHLCEYDLFVLPSRSEGFGLSVAEAMCAKVPVLVCNLEGAMDVIDGGRLGSSFKADDPYSLAEQIIQFLETGTNDDVVEAAYHFVVERFDISRTAHRYIEEYRKVLNQ